MINIEYTEEYLEGEPGPNFYWRGKPYDYLRLVDDLHRLGTSADVEISLNSLEYIQCSENYQLIAKSSNGGKILCKNENDMCLINLEPSLWQQVLGKFLRISFYPSHDYVEFEHVELVEHANFIISSEA